MAHIADFLVDTPSSAGLNNYIARELSPHSSHDASTEVPQADEKEKYVWRMHQPTEPRKYQLFPTKDRLSVAAGQKNAEAEQSQSQSTTIGQNGSTEKERSLLGTALRLKPKEQTLIRRRKVSVPELGPMTTVQEIAMDSPTIPGRPPLHERSISAPGNSWRQHVFGESMMSCISGPALDENAEMAISADSTNAPAAANIPQGIQQNCQSSSASSSNNPRSVSPKQPLSPKSLAPLVIPSSSPSQIQRIPRKPSGTRLRSGSTPPDVPPKSARMIDNSPYSRASPYTPMSASSTSLLSATTAPTSMAATPNSAIPISIPEGRSSPKLARSVTPTPPSACPGPMVPGHSRGVSDAPQRQFPLGASHGHRRHESEGGASIMDRGRPKKRADASPVKRSISKRSPSTSATLLEEQKAFEHLPSGHPATTASTFLPASEVETLRKQAIGQASRFEVLNSKDVDTLSRELRALDERCEYLRKTHRSLRSGRRNLHDRICTYLRSPRVAKFSHDSMLKQEEALSELDSSIDDWVAKLEQAENRRTRVRQKLLEHVAAALIMQPVVEQERGGHVVEEEKHVVQIALAMAIAPNGENTPPRSPTKGQSPERLDRVVEEVKVTSPESRRGGRDVESIRIYADSDLSALLADVEEEINRMGEQGEMHERERLERERQERERKTEDTIAAGITLNAVAFEGMLAHQRSLQNMKMPMPEFV